MSGKPNAIIVMGVAGSGKTTVGVELAREIGFEFADADDFHSAANKQKMASGEPLDDADRAPWLAAVRTWIAQRVEAGVSVVVACSALKEAYRHTLSQEPEPVRLQFVYLQASEDLTAERLRERKAHYMKVNLLRSQYATLEAPTAQEAWIVDASCPVVEIVRDIRMKLAKA